MIEQNSITALRMERQFLSCRAAQEEYDQLYRDTSPGQSVYWHGFGEPPSITYRASFDDVSYNRERQRSRGLVKGRFQGGNLGWILRDDLELFAGLCGKPLDNPAPRQSMLLDLIRREGPMNIQMMKEITGLLVKEITPVLHRMQEAFLVYEDQYDGEWDRAWYTFDEMFPNVDIKKYTRHDALCIVLPRFAFRHVIFDADMAKSFYKLPAKDIKEALKNLIQSSCFVMRDGYYMLNTDQQILESAQPELNPSVFVMHRNDFLVKSNEHVLKKKFQSLEHETLQYILVDGKFQGAVIGKFKYGPYVLEDVILSLTDEEKERRKAEIIEEIYAVNGRRNPLKRYDGKAL